ncbi:MAG: Mth938-like domain-containing protein [Alphaproteobacteria bacterium]|nr:Mth938-like domain-containing protein [Alphaproteobacteria bacterium SS10]
MDVTPLIPSDRKVIVGYGATGFRINDAVHEGAVIVTPTAVQPWTAASPDALEVQDFSFLGAETGLEVLLIGTGSKMRFVPPKLRAAIRELGPVPEIMDSGAACRTFNVLLAEGRQVAAALFPAEA